MRAGGSIHFCATVLFRATASPGEWLGGAGEGIIEHHGADVRWWRRLCYHSDRHTVTRIYTRTGDKGETGLFGGGRVQKSHPRVVAYGAVDELNAALGVALASLSDPEIGARLATVQADLFALGSHLATPRAPGEEMHPYLPELPAGRIREFERWIDEADAELPELHAFILPGGAPGAAALHMARTVCRRAESQIIALDQMESVDPEIIAYMNRLSDLLFQFARLANLRAGGEDTLWLPQRERRAEGEGGGA